MFLQKNFCGVSNVQKQFPRSTTLREAYRGRRHRLNEPTGAAPFREKAGGSRGTNGMLGNKIGVNQKDKKNPREAKLRAGSWVQTGSN